jgi:hypothetical protein
MENPLKKLFQPDKPATSELDRRQAAIDEELAGHQAVDAERAQLVAAEKSAIADKERELKAMAAVHDSTSERFPFVTEEEKTASRQRAAVAVNAASKATEARAAHEIKYGDEAALGERSKALADKTEKLSEDKRAARYRPKVSRLLAAAVAFADAEQDVYLEEADAFREDTLGGQIRRAPGIVPVSWPAGVLRPSMAPDGTKRSLLDSILFAAGIAYPDLLPAAVAESVLEKVAAWRAKGDGILVLPRRQEWYMAGGHHPGALREGEEFALLRGRTRLESLGLIR